MLTKQEEVIKRKPLARGRTSVMDTFVTAQLIQQKDAKTNKPTNSCHETEWLCGAAVTVAEPPQWQLGGWNRLKLLLFGSKCPAVVRFLQMDDKSFLRASGY